MENNSLHKFIVSLFQSVIDSVQQSGLYVGRSIDSALKKTLSVKVTNPQSKVEVTGKVDVDYSKLEAQMKNQALAIRELKKPLASLKEVTVSNISAFPKFPAFPKPLPFPEFPKETKVSNLKEVVDGLSKLEKKLSTLKLDPEIKVAAPIVNVPAPIVNIPKQPTPQVNVEAPDLTSITKIIEFLNDIGPKNPLSVRLSDGQKFYKALEKMADIYAGSSFSAFMSTTGEDARAQLNRNNELRVTVSDTWSLNNTHTIGLLTYLGEETVDGSWRITLVEKVGTRNIMHYATKRNNAATESFDYQQAWDIHATLDYGRVSEAL